MVKHALCQVPNGRCCSVRLAPCVAYLPRLSCGFGAVAGWFGPLVACFGGSVLLASDDGPVVLGGTFQRDAVVMVLLLGCALLLSYHRLHR